MRQYEAGTWYDQNGRIVWTNNPNGLPGVGWLDETRQEPRPRRVGQDPRREPLGTDLHRHRRHDARRPREVTRHFVGPFTQCDRIEDYKRAWAHFERLKSEEAA